MSETSMPEAVNSYEVYLEDAMLAGTAEAQLPSFESITTTIKGAGIAGEDETPMKALFGPQTLTLNWRIVSAGHIKLMEPAKAHSLNLYASLQEYDTATGETLDKQLHVYVKGRTKKSDPGKFATGETADTSTEIGINYIKIEKEGVELVEYDKYNYIYRVNGTDYAEKIRQNIGRA